MQKQGRIKSIVIKDFSRFGRRLSGSGGIIWKKSCQSLVFELISINDGFDSINSSGFTGGMSVALKKYAERNVQQRFVQKSSFCDENTC